MTILTYTVGLILNYCEVIYFGLKVTVGRGHISVVQGSQLLDGATSWRMAEVEFVPFGSVESASGFALGVKDVPCSGKAKCSTCKKSPDIGFGFAHQLLILWSLRAPRRLYNAVLVLGQRRIRLPNINTALYVSCLLALFCDVSTRARIMATDPYCCQGLPGQPHRSIHVTVSRGRHCYAKPRCSNC